MKTLELISAKDFCLHHQIEVDFLQSLHQFGLIEITTQDENYFFDSEQVEEIEKIIRLHYDLQVNFEGIDVIQNLLHKMEMLQEEMTQLKSRLRLHESNA